jgi:hypothetical protein
MSTKKKTPLWASKGIRRGSITRVEELGRCYRCNAPQVDASVSQIVFVDGENRPDCEAADWDSDTKSTAHQASGQVV